MRPAINQRMKTMPMSGEDLPPSASVDPADEVSPRADEAIEQAPAAKAGDAVPAQSAPLTSVSRTRPGGVRRVPKPKMTGLLDSPIRNLTFGVIYVMIVMTLATAGYMAAGWSFRDAIYMVVVTVYTVGYGEVRPINTPALYLITISLIVLGCTGFIFLTGALVQFITVNQLTRIMGHKRMKAQIDQLTDHVIICGFGRIGVALAQALSAARAGFVVVEQGEARANQAIEAGYLCLHGDAANEAVLHAGGVMRARVLVTALPADAVNVFITLSARALNSELSSSPAARSEHREQAPAGRCRQGGAADPHRRRADCRADPVRGIGALDRRP